MFSLFLKNYVTLKKFFSSLKLLNYPLYSLVSDDNLNFPQTCLEIYPKASWQLCTNHFKENIRASLAVRTDPKYRHFMHGIEHLFRSKVSEESFNKLAKQLLHKYINDELCVRILLDIEKRKPNLLGYLSFKNTPTTSNLIESFNSHLNIRLKSIKGFENFHHANLWLNGYFINRRTAPFTDCSGKFRHLNNKCSLEMTLKSGIDLPTFF
jgi:transposase-like protein